MGEESFEISNKGTDKDRSSKPKSKPYNHRVELSGGVITWNIA